MGILQATSHPDRLYNCLLVGRSGLLRSTRSPASALNLEWVLLSLVVALGMLTKGTILHLCLAFPGLVTGLYLAKDWEWQGSHANILSWDHGG
jgi:hypothetical protein